MCSDWTLVEDAHVRARIHHRCEICAERIDRGTTYLQRHAVIAGRGHERTPMHYGCYLVWLAVLHASGRDCATYELPEDFDEWGNDGRLHAALVRISRSHPDSARLWRLWQVQVQNVAGRRDVWPRAWQPSWSDWSSPPRGWLVHVGSR